VWLKSAIAKTPDERERGIQSAQDPVLDHSQKTGETALPDWLKGWWSVNDGEQYYYYFGESHGCYHTKVPPPQVTLAWDHYGAVEKFTRVPGANPGAMSGTSNKYGALAATKMQN